MKTAFKIAWRFLFSSKGQTVLIVLGIAVGVSVQVFIGSLISGLQKSLVDATIGRSSQITVKAAERSGLIDNYQELVSKIAGTEGVTAVSPAADASGFLKAGSEVYPVLVRGLDFLKAEGIYKLQSSVVSGSLPREGEVMLGKELMEESKVKPGDLVTILTPAGSQREVRVSGTYDLKVTGLNKSWVVTDLALVKQVFGYGDKATSIETQVSAPFEADKTAKAIAALLPGGLKAENWKELNASLLSGLSGQSISSLMIQVFVMVSVILAIASVLAISVMQKSRQLGILKAMGIKNRTASLIFLTQGFILGLIGAMLGVLLGFSLLTVFSKFALKPDGSPVVPLFIDPGFITLSALIALAAATLAALIPARRSSRLDPMEVIKNG